MLAVAEPWFPLSHHMDCPEPKTSIGVPSVQYSNPAFSNWVVASVVNWLMIVEGEAPASAQYS